jgi:uncharacterized membrane protein
MFPESKFLNSNKMQIIFCIVLTVIAMLFWALTFGID